MKSPSNFERLVLGCMDSYDSDQRLILQGFSRSTRLAFLCTAQTSKISAKSVKLFGRNEMKFHEISFHSDFFAFFPVSFAIFLPNFDEFFSEFRRQSQKMTEFVDIRAKTTKFL